MDPIPCAVLQQPVLALALGLASGPFTGKAHKVLSCEVI